MKRSYLYFSSHFVNSESINCELQRGKQETHELNIKIKKTQQCLALGLKAVWLHFSLFVEKKTTNNSNKVGVSGYLGIMIIYMLSVLDSVAVDSYNAVASHSFLF